MDSQTQTAESAHTQQPDSLCSHSESCTDHPLMVLRCGDRHYPLKNGDYLQIGRSQLCNIRVPDDLRVSRVHCAISAADGHVYVRDLGSSNGTFVNEERICGQPWELHPGNVINIGDTILPVTLPYEQQTAPKPR